MGNVKRLRGWKEIERHVRLSRKTILLQGYPIHKTKKLGGVFAYTEELDAHEKCSSSSGNATFPNIP